MYVLYIPCNPGLDKNRFWRDVTVRILDYMTGIDYIDIMAKNAGMHGCLSNNRDPLVTWGLATLLFLHLSACETIESWCLPRLKSIYSMELNGVKTTLPTCEIATALIQRKEMKRNINRPTKNPSSTYHNHLRHPGP